MRSLSAILYCHPVAVKGVFMMAAIFNEGTKQVSSCTGQLQDLDGKCGCMNLILKSSFLCFLPLQDQSKVDHHRNKQQNWLALAVNFGFAFVLFFSQDQIKLQCIRLVYRDSLSSYQQKTIDL